MAPPTNVVNVLPHTVTARALVPADERSLPPALEDLIERARAAQPRVLDGWEATALVESLGYTDERVLREFGFADTRQAGEFLWDVMTEGGRAPSATRWQPAKRMSPAAIILRSGASTLIYAVPWLAIFIAQAVKPDIMRLPATVSSSLALALMFSLVASGGFVQAIVRRGEFYVGLRQPALAWRVVLALLRVGVMASVTVAAIGIFLGWYFALFPWQSLVLGADAFVIMTVLWMVCSLFSIRQQQWRVAAASLTGFGSFVLLRSIGVHPVTGQLSSAAVVLVVAGLQMRRLFSGADDAIVSPNVALPRLSVVVYRTLPFFCYGLVYFGFLFADRLTAGTALAFAAGDPFSIPAQYSLGAELALLTLLLAASGVEIAGALFARAFSREGLRGLDEGAVSLHAALCRHHRRAVVFATASFVVTATAVSIGAGSLLATSLTPHAWSAMVAGDIGYGLLAIALLNALVLFETGRPWAVVRHFAIGLAINVGSGYVLSHAFGSPHAIDGLLLGAAYLSVASTSAVRDTLARADYAYAMS